MTLKRRLTIKYHKSKCKAGGRERRRKNMVLELVIGKTWLLRVIREDFSRKVASEG